MESNKEEYTELLVHNGVTHSFLEYSDKSAVVATSYMPIFLIVGLV